MIQLLVSAMKNKRRHLKLLQLPCSTYPATLGCQWTQHGSTGCNTWRYTLQKQVNQETKMSLFAMNKDTCMFKMLQLRRVLTQRREALDQHWLEFVITNVQIGCKRELLSLSIERQRAYQLGQEHLHNFFSFFNWVAGSSLMLLYCTARYSATRQQKKYC